MTLLREKEEELDAQSEIDGAWYNYNWSDYKSFKTWFDKYRLDLSNEARDEFRKIMEDIEPSNFHLIKDEVWK